jgi:transcriptional regulator with XRE-family HTH domain
MISTINSDLLASMIKSKRKDQGLRATAENIGGVSAATISRIEQGKLPDVETFIKICKWLEVPTDTFIIGEKTTISKMGNKDLIAAQLRADRELDKDVVEAIVRMIDLAYEKTSKHGKKK